MADTIYMKDLCEMNLHDRLYVEEFEIIRVPGGWIYKWEDYQGYNQNNSQRYANRVVFVPYTRKF